MDYVERVLSHLKEQNADQPEFIEAATEILTSLKPIIDQHPEYEKASLGFIELMKDDYETAKVMLNNMWRAKQRVTMQVIRRILSERKPTTN